MDRHTFYCHKLVRDKKPDFLRKNNVIVDTTVLQGDDLICALFDKIRCEAREAHEAYRAENHAETEKELSDTQEALYSLIDVLDVKDFKERCDQRVEELGCYSCGVCMAQTEQDAGCCPNKGFKLVRHKKPEIFEKKGQVVKTCTIQGPELIKKLFEKIQCETVEALQGHKAGDRNETIKELTDVQNALCSLVETLKYKDFDALYQERKEKLGSYRPGVSIVSLNVPHDHPNFEMFQRQCQNHTHPQSCTKKECS